MASFPATIKSFIAKINGGVIEASHVNDLQEEMVAVQTKLGVDSSADTSSVNYQLTNASSVNPGHKHTLAGALTDVEITSPMDGQGLVYETASGKFKNATTSVANADLGVAGITELSVAPVSDPIAVGDNDPRIPTTNEKDAMQGTVGSPSDSNRYVTDNDTGTTANKVLRIDAGGKLPAIDGSQLTDLPTSLSHHGVLPVGVKIAGSSYWIPNNVTSPNAGATDTLYATAYASVSYGPKLIKYTSSGGVFKPTHRVETSGYAAAASGKLGVTVMGSYVYTIGYTGSSYLLKRFNASDLTGETSMTISGTAVNSPVIFNDGTYLYMNSSGSTTFTRYSVSGTTATSVSTVSYTSYAVGAVTFSDGTYMYSPENASYSDRYRRWAIAGGSPTTLYTDYVDFMSVDTNKPSCGIFKLSGGSGLCVSNHLGSNIAYALDTTLY